MSNHMDPLSVQCELPANLFNHSSQITDIVRAALTQIAVVPFAANPVRVAVEKSSCLRQREELHAVFIVGTGATEAVQQDHKGQRCLTVIAGRNIDTYWPGSGDPVKRGRDGRLNGSNSLDGRADVIIDTRERLPRPGRVVGPFQLAAPTPRKEVDV